MILRRMMEHVRTQNWLAVALDFVIVVVGVFIGIQLGNWNEARADQARYEQARQQLIDETKTNLDIVDTYIGDYETRLKDVRASISILRSCETGPEALRAVERGLDTLRSTPVLILQTSAIAYLNENENMLAILEDTERVRLQAYYRSIRRTLDGADAVEHVPERSPVEDHPMVGYGERSAGYVAVNRADERPLTLVVPLEEACQDAVLAKHFYLWERAGVFSRLIGENLEVNLKTNLDALGATP